MPEWYARRNVTAWPASSAGPENRAGHMLALANPGTDSAWETECSWREWLVRRRKEGASLTGTTTIVRSAGREVFEESAFGSCFRSSVQRCGLRAYSFGLRV